MAPGPTAPTPNRTQVHSRFHSLDLRWQRRVHVRHCYPPRELANGEFETHFCNVCPIWRWPDIGGNALTNHNRNPNTSLGFVTPPSGPLLKGLILCKPDLDDRLMLLRAPDPGAPRGCHVAAFPRLYSRRYSKLRPSSGLWAPWALRGGFSDGPLRVSEEGFPRVRGERTG